MPTSDKPIRIAVNTSSARPTRDSTTFRFASSVLARDRRSEHRAEPHRDHQRHAHPKRAGNHRQQREVRGRDPELHAVEPAEHVALDAQHRHHHRGPHDGRHDLLDDRQPRVRMAVAREHAPREEEQHVDQSDAEQRHERERQQRRRHERVERELRAADEHAAEQRKQRTFQALRARARRASGRPPVLIDPTVHDARGHPGEAQRPDEDRRLPDHHRLVEIANHRCQPVRQQAALQTLHRPSEPPYCAARRSSTAAKKPSVAWRCGHSDR